MQKNFILIGIILIVLGLIWPMLSKWPIGRLPGDIVIQKPNLKIIIPITTMILFSILLNILFRFFRK
jgi:hypothetical protein